MSETLDVLAAALCEKPHGDPLPEGPREEVRLLLEAIREGHELHYGRSRLLHTQDPDLDLLAGDRLYALGLDRLADLGDLRAVAALADLISLSARAHAEDRPDVADAAWADAVAEIHGAGPAKPGTTDA